MTNLIDLIISILTGFLFNTEDNNQKFAVATIINKLQGIKLHMVIENSNISIETKNNIHQLIDDIVCRTRDIETNIAQNLYEYFSIKKVKPLIERYPRYVAKYKQNKITKLYTVTIVDNMERSEMKYHTFDENKTGIEYIREKFNIVVGRMYKIPHMYSNRFKPKHIYAKPWIGQKKRISRNGGLCFNT